MLKLDTIADLETLHLNQVQESSTLEYKASGAVSNVDKVRTEIAKDASAMANANGGQIVYGMKEANHLPQGLDDGVDRAFNGLWFEQVIQQNVAPAIEGLHIKEIILPSGNAAIVLTVSISPASESFRVAFAVKLGRVRLTTPEGYAGTVGWG